MMAESPVVATIDMGSNATRVRIFCFTASGRMIELQRHRFAVQLGAGSFGENRLQDAPMNDAIRALKDASVMASAAGAVATLAVATSAVREASNGGEFIERARSEAGVDLKVISGKEEARLAALGAVAGAKGGDGGGRGGYVIDIGGGSTEVVLMTNGGIVQWYRSLPLGVVRLANEMEGWQDRGIASQEAALKEGIENVLLEWLGSDPLPEATAEAAYALGGTPAALEMMQATLGPDREVGRGESALSQVDIRALLSVVRSTTPDELSEKYGVPPMRGPLLLPGALILLAIMERMGLSRIAPTDRGICEGLALRWLAANA